MRTLFRFVALLMLACIVLSIIGAVLWVLVFGSGALKSTSNELT